VNRAGRESARLRRRLQARRRSAAEAAARRLLGDPSADPVPEAEKVEAYDDIVAGLDSKSLLKRWAPVFVALACFAIVGGLYGIQRGKTKVLLVLEAQTLSLRLAAPATWRMEMPMGPPVQVTGVGRIESWLFAGPLESRHGDAWLTISRGDVSLSELTMDEGGLVEFEVEAGRRSVYMNGAALGGSILVAGQAGLGAGRAFDGAGVHTEETLLGPESLDFEADGAGAVPVILAFGGTRPYTLYDVPVRGLAFSREVYRGVTGVHSVSTIFSGAIRLPEVKADVAVGPGEQVLLQGLTGRVAQLELGERIRIQFEGEARRVKLGPAGFERDLTPSWLMYLYNQEKLAFIWSAFLFLWGVLWSIRKTVFG
jgi:hypothetical protein